MSVGLFSLAGFGGADFLFFEVGDTEAGFDGFEGDGEVLAIEGNEVVGEVCGAGFELEEAEDEVGHFATGEVGVWFADGVGDEVVGGEGIDEVGVPRRAFGKLKIK